MKRKQYRIYYFHPTTFDQGFTVWQNSLQRVLEEEMYLASIGYETQVMKR